MHTKRKRVSSGAEEELKRERRVHKGQGWCRRVGGGWGKSRHNTTGKGMEAMNLFGPLVQP